MMNAGADAFGRVPPSAAMGATLQRSADYARHQSHRLVTLEHLLLALCDDPDAGRVLAASRVDVRQIMIDASSFVGRIDDRSPPGQPVEPLLDSELSRILDYATVAAQQSGRREINGAIVLAAIIGDERSAAATMLRAQGLTFDEAISVLRQTARQPGDAPPAPPSQQAYSTSQILADVRARVDQGGGGRMPEWATANPPISPPLHPSLAHAHPAYQPGWPTADPQPQPQPSQWPAPQPNYHQPTDHAPTGYPPPAARTESPPGRPPAAPARRPQAQSAAPTQPPPARPISGVDAAALAGLLPDLVTRDVPAAFEIRVARADLADLGVALGSGPGAARADLIVSRSLTVRLRSPDGRLTVEPVTPETQWIERDPSYLTADDVCWRWTVTGRRTGTATLQLSIAARTVAMDGMPVDSALPDQSHEISVATNWTRVIGRVAVLTAAVIGGAALAMTGSMLVALAARVIARA